MKITVLANRDLAACVALNHLLPELLPDHEVQCILSSRVGGSGERPEPLRQLAFFEQTLFTDLLFPLLETNDAIGSGQWLSFSGLAQQCGQPLLTMNKINRGEDLQVFSATSPDLVISIRYGVILRAPVISRPRYGVLNLHSGLLPEYRGVMASFWAMLAGAERIGTTLHFIADEGIDTGPIVSTSSMPLQQNQSYLWHVLALYEQGCRDILDAVKLIASGAALSTSEQPVGAGRYFGFPDQGALDRFFNAGYSLVDYDHITHLMRRFTHS